jgi:hypothetical protein
MKTVNILTALMLMVGISGGSASAEFQGAQNTFYGVNAGINTAGDDDVNTFIGADAGFTNTTGAFNTFLGGDVGVANSTGSHNTLVGAAAGPNNSTGSENSFFGSFSGHLNTTGSENTFLGSHTGWNNGIGSDNIFLGSRAGYNNNLGSGNIFLGNYAGLSNQAGNNLIFLGHQAGYRNLTGKRLSFLGYQAGFSNLSGDDNTFVGFNAGYTNSTGYANTFVGTKAGYNNTLAVANTFVGNSAGYNTNSGGANTFLGFQAGYRNTDGFSNTFLGPNAGYSNTVGDNNIFLGLDAGYSNTIGSANVFLGRAAGCFETGSNKLYIDNSSTGSPLIYGNFATNALTFTLPLNVTGSLTKGSGTFVQPHPVDPSKEVAYAFFEGPEHAVFLRGKARLVKGRATIKTPEYFRVVAGKDEDVTVQFTPRSIDTFGVAAVQVTKDSIEVRELKGGKHTYEFDYFITAKRGGFEGHQPIRANTHFTADQKTAEDFEQSYAKTDDLTINAMRRLLIANGILTRDGKLNSTTAAKLGWYVQPMRVVASEPQMTQSK